MMTMRTLTILVSLTLAAGLGCRVEHVPSRAAARRAEMERRADSAVQPSPLPNVDDAQLVLSACPQPLTDQTLSLYDKVHNGPVREIVYAGSQGQAVVLDFIPSTQPATQNGAPAPAALPAGAVWRFSDGHTGQQELMTSTRIAPFLPCAAKALSSEY